MSFYQQIAPYYHHIFKTNIHQVNFVKSKIETIDSHILDIGCGIGTLSKELSPYYNKVQGIDMDAEMIRKANSSINSESLSFQQMSMLDLETSFSKASIDGIVCFGNTLVHLNSLDEIESFLKQSKKALKPKGKLLLQIVNYDRILNKSIKSLPQIDNDEIIFERNYNYLKTAHKIEFNTRLTVKNSGKVIENSIQLLPVLKDELAMLLTKTGFNNCNYYGNFIPDSYSIESPALIVEAW